MATVLFIFFYSLCMLISLTGLILEYKFFWTLHMLSG